MSLKDTYRNPSNIDARVQLHDRYSENTYPWQRWVFDHIGPDLHGVVLEIGCGPGYLWTDNQDRIPTDCTLFLSDLHHGMTTEARMRLPESLLETKVLVLDAEMIPFDDNSYDVIIANHVLFLVPGLDRALEEVRRVLRPGGAFFATTNDSDHMLELIALFASFDPQHFGYLLEDECSHIRERFDFKHAHESLHAIFSSIDLERRSDRLRVDKIEPLIPWVDFWAKEPLPLDRMKTLLQCLERRIQADGAIVITKTSGLFSCR
jgi:ubiquinone/menaquinone biosynthesis C-methylase UbiE